MYTVTNMSKDYHRIFQYFADLTVAEDRAIEIMTESDILWARGEYANHNCFEYIERGTTGTARVYVRISFEEKSKFCDVCENIATHEYVDGIFCDNHENTELDEE